MCNLEHVSCAGLSSEFLLGSDKKILLFYHLWKNGSVTLSTEDVRNLMVMIEALFKDREFNKRFFSFQQNLKIQGIDFPYLNELKKIQLLCAISNSPNLGADDKEFLTVYYKVKNHPEQTFLREREQLTAYMRMKLRTKQFKLNLAEFSEELKKNSIEFPYLDVLKHQQVYFAIEINDYFTQAEKRYLTLFYKTKNEAHLVLPDEIREFNELVESRGYDRSFNVKVELFVKTMRREKIELPYFDELLKNLVETTIQNYKSLTPENRDFFVLYHKVMNYSSSTSTPSERAQLTKMLNSPIKMAQVNEQINILEQEMRSNKLVFPHLDTLRNYTFGIRNAGFFNTFIKRVKLTEYVVSRGGEISKNEKLTLSELGLIEKVANLKKCFEHFSNQGVVLTSKSAKNLANQSNTLGLIHEKIKEYYQPEIYQSGDVVVSDQDRTFAYKLEHHIKKPFFDKGNLFNIGKRQVSRYGHAAQLIEVNGTIQQSHMWSRHTIEHFGVEHVIQSDIFRLDITKLIAPSKREALEQTLGPDWKEKLQKLYAEKISEVSRNTALEKARIISGAESIGVLFPHWYGRNSKNGFRLFKDDRLEKDRMVCSDFVAREINEAICLVNETLKQQLGENDNGQNPIKSPFPWYVNPSRVSPSHLIQLLKRAGCITQLKSTKLKELVRDDHYEGIMHTDVESTAMLYNKLVNLAHKNKQRHQFIEAGKTIFEAYLAVNLSMSPDDKNKMWVNELVNYTLIDLYEHHSSTNDTNLLTIFIKFIKKLAHFMGIKDKESQAFIDATVDLINKRTHSEPMKDEVEETDLEEIDSVEKKEQQPVFRP